MKARIFFTGLLFLWILGCGLYVWLFREWVSLAYQGNAPSFFTNLVNELYPRFTVEKHRFPLSFFLNKADQIFIRGSFVIGLAYVAMLWNTSGLWKRVAWQKCSIQHAQLLRILFYTGLLFYTWDWIMDLQRLTVLQSFYKPVFLFELFHLPLPDFWVFAGVYGVYLVSIFCIILNIKPILSAALIAVIFIMMQGYFFSFEKIDHGYATLTYAVMFMPFFIAETQQHRYQPFIKSWSLSVIQVAIAGAYFFAGLEKLFTGGISWATAHTFRTYLYLHQAPLGLQVAESEILSNLLPVFALLFQLGFILIIFFPRLRYLLLPAGLVFHMGTVVLFHIGSYLTSWIFVYIFFIHWEWVINKVADHLLGKKFINLLRLKLPKTT